MQEQISISATTTKEVDSVLEKVEVVEEVKVEVLEEKVEEEGQEEAKTD